MAQSKHVQRLQSFYAECSLEKLEQLAEIYHPDIIFEDPIERVEGITALSHYFEHGLGNAKSCTFAFEHVVEGDESTFLTWTMNLSHTAIQGGKPISVPGASFIQFEKGTGLVRIHRDYYDLGAMVYQHLPVIGFLIQQVRKRLECK